MQTIFLILFGILFGIAVTIIFEFILRENRKFFEKIRPDKNMFGWHIHHSSYGLLFILLAIILHLNGSSTPNLFYFSFGIGIIIQHTLVSGRLVFIEKNK